MYCTIPTLRDYLFVDQYSIDVEHRFLQSGRWESKRYSNRDEVIQLVGASITLRVSDLYARVEFTASRP